MQLSITRVIAEIKTLDKRISSAIDELSFVAGTRGLNQLLSVAGYPGEKAEDVVNDIKSNHMSYTALVKRRDALRKALLISNATATVIIGGKEMVVVEAINRKKTIGEDEKLLNRMRGNYTRITEQSEQARINMEKEEQAARQTAVNSGKKFTDEQIMDILVNPIREQKTPGILDPLDVKTLISNLDKEIKEFKSEVDYVLSEHNAKTMIDVPELG